MYIGTQLWKDRLPINFVKKTLRSGRVIETFPDMPESLYAFLERSASLRPDHTAVADDLGRKLTFRQLKEKTDRFAAYLRYERNLAKGSHIAIMAYSTAEFITAFLAVIKTGAVAVILPTKFKEQEIRSLSERADLNAVICDRKYEAWFDAFAQKGLPVLSYTPEEGSFALDPFSVRKGGSGTEGSGSEDGEMPFASLAGYEDVSVMMFTSGTTSMSKGVLLTNFNFVHAAGVYTSIFHINAEDITVIPVPIYTITALSAVIGSFLYAGGTIHLQRIFHAKQVLSCIRDEHVTYMHAAPTVCSLLLEQREEFPSLPSLRRIVCGGSRMPLEKIRRIGEWLPDCEYHNVYGMTETTSPGTIQPDPALRSRECASNGIPVPGLIYKVTDENNRELPAGEIGEIKVSGACIMEGYYQLETPDYQDGWLSTGDMGYFTPEGCCYVCDRKKDMINRGGEKMTSFDVEEQLYGMDGISEAAVVGIPDELYGEVPAALVKLERGASLDEEEIRTYLKSRIAKYKIPVKVRFVEEIPLSSGGKPDKKKIRRMLMTD